MRRTGDQRGLEQRTSSCPYRWARDDYSAAHAPRRRTQRRRDDELMTLRGRGVQRLPLEILTEKRDYRPTD